MANNDYEAGLKGETVGHDTFSPSYQQGAQERERRAKGGSSVNTEGMVAAGSGNIVFAALAVILAFLAFVASFCVYPIAGAATLVAFLIGASMAGSGMNFVGLVFMMMAPCYIVHYLCRPLEEKMGRREGYRIFRQYWRLAVGTYAMHELGTVFHMRSDYPDGAPFSGYMIDLAMTVAGFFLLYLNSQRLDRNAGLEPVDNAHIDRILAPVLSRIVPPVARNTRETGMIRARTAAGDIDIGISGGNIIAGSRRIPLSQVYHVKTLRDHRGKLIAGGVLLFFLAPVIANGIFGNLDDFMPQMFGLAGLVAGALMALFGAVPNTPAGKLGGPFRSTEIFYSDEKNTGAAETVRFTRPEDERLFMQAVANGLKQAEASAPLAAAA